MKSKADDPLKYGVSLVDGAFVGPASGASGGVRVVLPSGFAAPVEVAADATPFTVSRTSKGQQIPVYTDYRNGRTACYTILRKYDGNVRALREELTKVCGMPVVERTGRLEVKGNHSQAIRRYLESLGF